MSANLPPVQVISIAEAFKPTQTEWDHRWQELRSCSVGHALRYGHRGGPGAGAPTLDTADELGRVACNTGLPACEPSDLPLAEQLQAVADCLLHAHQMESGYL